MPSEKEGQKRRESESKDEEVERRGDDKKDDTEVLGLANVQFNPSPRQLLFQGFGNGHQTSGTVLEPKKFKFSNS